MIHFRLIFICLAVLFLAFISLASIPLVSADGRSVDDLVGVFSIEKTIKIGSSSACFNSQGNSNLEDPTSYPALSSDSQPPNLLGFDLAPKVIDTSTSSQNITLTAKVVDDWSGLRAVGGDGSDNVSKVTFVSPTGSQRAVATINPSDLISGDDLDGVYRDSITLPQGSEKGAWMLESLNLMDRGGNVRTFRRDDLISKGLPAEFLVN
jgi:hypothetical protein